MVGALFDTNILIDHLNALPEAREEIERFESRAISIITWMEVMVGARADLIEPTRLFLDGFKVIALDDEIAKRAVDLRRAHRIKLPDAVIWATAQTTGRLLVTRNTKDFPPDDPGVREPYAL
ncbi:VapC toxin family PIN domain ribonuclease [Rhodospirillum rubrum]|uniref:type II toxin-antitoxin system VapC family toxin n=1 Tax=Rhodospirillum rubrum TaxID=1085 RepID=UPI0019038330|nr:type II toxin-antitoxin system VapC family toxin [Rhodospirillum rubrum]MBK1665016.1 VapC toxin family PIN domain ribonuclease [Rhodospirillum rubrum]MBK1676565.1 VapC toxin family PIN domain ribonuclease [Rhodospirillum rubrum]